MHTTPQPRRAAAAAFIGTTIEFYDFYIYATAAALVLGQVFFPSSDPVMSTLAAFGSFAVGFIARPMAGMVFGHLGDRLGRKKMLLVTMALMGLATAGIGLLPSYASVGIWAPVGLIVLRLIQGISVGGEWGGADGQRTRAGQAQDVLCFVRPTRKPGGFAVGVDRFSLGHLA
jgi:MFS family permease